MSYSETIIETALSIDAAALLQMKAHAKQTYPYECCGFMFGKDGSPRRITSVTEVVNSKEGDQRRRFEIKPTDYMKAEKYALDNDLDLLGVYHSHPDHPALPSETDLKMAVPFFSYVIIAVTSETIKDTSSWQLGDQGLFERETIEINKTNN